MKGEWCSGGGKGVEGGLQSVQPNRRRTRCPECNRLLMLQQQDCEAGRGGGECWHEILPPHRVKVKRPRMPSRRSGSCRARSR